MAKVQSTDITGAKKDMEQQEVTFIAGRDENWCSHHLRTCKPS